MDAKTRDKSVIAGFILAINTINALRDPTGKGFRKLMTKEEGVGVEEIVATLTALTTTFAAQSSVTPAEMQAALDKHEVQKAMAHDGAKH